MSFQEAYRKAKAAALGRPDKAAALPKTKAKPKENTKQRVKEIVAARATQKQNSGRPRETVFETIALNLEEKIKVQVDSRTIVYMRPGDDPERIKAKYKRKPLSDKIDIINPNY